MWVKIIQSRIWYYIFAGLVSVLLLTLSLHVFPYLTLNLLLIDSFLFTCWLFLLIFLTINVIKFGNFELVPLPVRLIIYGLLGCLALFLLLGGGYWISVNLLDEVIPEQLIDLLYIKGTFSFLISLLAFQKFNAKEVEMAKVISDELIQPSNTEKDKLIVEESKREITDRISVKSGTKIHVIPVVEIICLFAEGDYVQLVTEKGKYLKEQTMKYFEQHLPDNLFLRIHRSCIVNITCISRIELYDKQNFHLLLKNGENVRVSVAGYKLLKDKLKL